MNEKYEVMTYEDSVVLNYSLSEEEAIEQT